MPDPDGHLRHASRGIVDLGGEQKGSVGVAGPDPEPELLWRLEGANPIEQDVMKVLVVWGEAPKTQEAVAGLADE
jgi:hypothetical protein